MKRIGHAAALLYEYTVFRERKIDLVDQARAFCVDAPQPFEPRIRMGEGGSVARSTVY